MQIPVIVDLAKSTEVCLSLRPLVWSLAFGACLGGWFKPFSTGSEDVGGVGIN